MKRPFHQHFLSLKQQVARFSSSTTRTVGIKPRLPFSTRRRYASAQPFHEKHCLTCSCPTLPTTTTTSTIAPCGELLAHKDPSPLPPPLPEPLYSFRRRRLDTTLTLPLQSEQGRDRFQRCLSHMYLALSQQSINQSEPAYCGITTAMIVLNTLQCDAVYRWKGGWRFWHDESVLLAACPCFDTTRVQREGIRMEQFQRILACQGVQCRMQRPNETNVDDIESFRRDVQSVLTEKKKTTANNADSATFMVPASLLVVSFARSTLKQTGDGHFSPLAAYDAVSDSVLVMDVARYKYPHYWVRVEQLYQAMLAPVDPVTEKARGWFVITPPTRERIMDEEKRLAQYVPLVGSGEEDPCPVHPIKVEYCRKQQDRMIDVGEGSNNKKR